MPIRGLSDRGLAFPEIGQIRKGAPKPNEKQPGKDLPYFRITFDEKEVEAQKKFSEKYGDKPDEINIILPFSELERMWDSWYEAYTAGRMVARADGEFYNYLVNTSTGEIIIKNWVDKEGKKRLFQANDVVGKDYQGKPIVAKPVGRLKVIIPELERIAYMTVLTSSIHDIGHLSEQLAALKEINNGQLAGIPMKLRRRPKMISCPGKEKGQRVRYQKYMLSIEADPDWVKRKLIDMKTLALPGNGLPEYASLPERAEEVVETTAQYMDDEDDSDIQSNPEEIAQPPQNMPPQGTQKPQDEPQQKKGITDPSADKDAPDDSGTPNIIKESIPPSENDFTDEVIAAMSKQDAPNEKLYGDLTIPELASKVNAKLARMKVDSDAKRVATLLKDVDALKMVMEYKKAHPEG